MTGASSLQTIAAFLNQTVSSRPGDPALGFIRDGQLHWRTWREVMADATRLVAVIQAAGVEPGDRVAQVSENRHEWVITDLALHLVGAVHVPIHVTLSGQQIAAQIDDCGARLVFVSSEELLLKFGDQLATNVQILVHEQQGACDDEALLDKFATANAKPPAVAPPAPSPQPLAQDDLATILYTSGTTGRPRGVMLSQRNLAANAAATADAHGGDNDQTRLCVLPLSHIYARTCDLYTWVYRGSRLVLAENRETLARDCQLVQPAAMSAVPYIYQRISEKVRASAPADEAAALRAVFGGKIERLSSGGAPLAPDIEDWYAKQGLPLLAGYGLTESSPVIAASTTECSRRGSVGRPLPNVEVRIADDGEIVVRGPSVMLGYWQDDAATAEVIRDGWLYTGDLGEIDADGFLFVRGRKKELIVLSTGKKVFPTRVESMLTASPHIEQAAVFGEGNSALVALIVPSTGVSANDAVGKSTRDKYTAEINRCLKHAAHEEQVRNFALLDRPFSIERGELTAKLSLCRQVIARNFHKELTGLLTQSSRNSNH